MTVRLYDSKAHALRDFIPVQHGRVGIYVCGPTVQSSPHIGHVRSALVYDLMRRWFEARGSTVTFVRNVTDIDDKILAAAGAEEWWALAYRVELEFSEAYRALGILAPTYEPRATASVTQMLDLIVRLIEAGHAYAADDDSGDVYFDTGSWPSYGELTRQSRDQMEGDAEVRGKRDAHDFALWKGRKPDEPESATWQSPWGEGRPGWHLECSAMSTRYLGSEFDIHGGGIDLRFPHHENELAQSSAAGDAYAHYWVHNGLVTVDGQKMSKSLGNSVYVADLFSLASPLAVRYLLGAAHYRSNLDYSPGSLTEAESAVERIRTYLERAERRLANTRYAGSAAEVLPESFGRAMDDDLSVPQALAVLHDTVRAGNHALDSEDLPTAAERHANVSAMVQMLGIDPRDPHWSGDDAGPATSALDALVTRLIADRRSAREAKDYAAADRIRAELASAGVTIEDTSSGTHWSL